MSLGAIARGFGQHLVPNDASALAHEIEGLVALDLHDLRSHWRRYLRSAPPAGLTRPLLLRLLAYKLQAKVLGDLDGGSAKFLDQLASAHARRREANPKHSRNKPPPVPPAARERGLMPGTLLVRQHAGVQHRVIVGADGFEWDGRQFQSLSEVARAITGTRWNGPRFFGLRDKVASSTREQVQS